MANPVVVDLDTGDWTKVAEDVTNAQVFADSDSAQFLLTLRDHDATAPTVDDLAEGLALTKYGRTIADTVSKDIYVYTASANRTVTVHP
jgi:hypothetical protein